MSLFTKLFEAVHSWRRRRGGLKSRKRADLAMEQLDHRQLLAVNFTGNVPIDFPANTPSGVAIVRPGPPGNTVPGIPPALNGIVSASGFQINQLRVTYTPSDDTLNVGVEGPPNGRDGRQVIATDADNNGNSGTVDPRVAAAEPGFADPPDVGGTESYGIFLNLKNPNVFPNNPQTPDVIAGFPISSANNQSAKPYEVARALAPPPGSSTPAPTFDQANLLPQFTGNYYLANDPNHPNFELQITRFSQLYQQTTGKPLTPGTPIAIGAFGNSAQDIGLGDEFFPPNTFTLGQATPPPPPAPVIAVTKATNGVAAPLAPGPMSAIGGPVIWSYDVTNPGNEPLKAVTLIDDAGTPGVPADDFQPTFVGGDANNNGLLDPGEDWKYRAQGVARPGQYENRVNVTAVGNTSGNPVSAVAVGHYLAPTPPPIVPPPTTVCPPVSPPVRINPHDKNHLNTAHASTIRVSVLGSSGFNPTTINPGTVHLGGVGTSAFSGAPAILNFERNVNRDQFPDETFVFNGLDVDLPPGVTDAEISGMTTSGQVFASSAKVFNRDYSFYTKSQINQQQLDFARYDLQHDLPIASGNFIAPPPPIPKAAQQRAATMALNDLYSPFAGRQAVKQAAPRSAGIPHSAAVKAPIVSIPTKHGKGVKAAKAQAVHVNMAGTRVAKGPSIQKIVAGGA